MAAYWTDFSWPEEATRPLVEALLQVWSQGRDQTKHLENIEVIRDEEAPARLDGAHMLMTRGRYPPDTGPTHVRSHSWSHSAGPI